MRKLNLSLEALVVETFTPSPRDAAARGTVHGNESGAETCVCETIGEYTCGTTGPGPQTMAYTCAGYTCPGFGETCYPAKTCAVSG